MLKMKDLDLNNKRVLIREDFNVPTEGNRITNEERIVRALPTIKEALSKNARVILMSHLGRPNEGEYDASLSLAPVAVALSHHLNQLVKLIQEWENGVEVNPGQCVLLENTRFLKGEKKNDENLSRRLASLCDVFVMDAFATAHRAQASTEGVAHYAPIACAGPLLVAELDALSKVLLNPKKPVVAIVGGSKVSTKIQLLENLVQKVDRLIVGGGIANTFLAAQGHTVGKSLYEEAFVLEASRLLKSASEKGVEIPLPTDIAVAKSFSAEATATIKSVDDVADDDMILDVGVETARTYAPMMKEAGTILWNGPVGVFEFHHFAHGTKALGEAIANSTAFSVAGGGDTLAAIDQFNLSKKISYISTGGGAFLEFIQGDILPAVAILEQRGKEHA